MVKETIVRIVSVPYMDGLLYGTWTSGTCVVPSHLLEGMVRRSESLVANVAHRELLTYSWRLSVCSQGTRSAVTRLLA
jgi:hypothetical protein